MARSPTAAVARKTLNALMLVASVRVMLIPLVGFSLWRERRRRSERNLVVHVIGAALGGRSRPTGGAVAVVVITADAIVLPRLALHDLEGAVGWPQHNLGRVVPLPLLLPGARLELALDHDLIALGEVLLDHANQTLVPDDDPVPFGALLALPGVPVFPALRRRKRHVGDLAAALEVHDFRVLAEIAEQDDLVQRSHLVGSFFSGVVAKGRERWDVGSADTRSRSTSRLGRALSPPSPWSV